VEPRQGQACSKGVIVDNAEECALEACGAATEEYGATCEKLRNADGSTLIWDRSEPGSWSDYVGPGCFEGDDNEVYFHSVGTIGTAGNKKWGRAVCKTEATPAPDTATPAPDTNVLDGKTCTYLMCKECAKCMKEVLKWMDKHCEEKKEGRCFAFDDADKKCGWSSFDTMKKCKNLGRDCFLKIACLSPCFCDTWKQDSCAGIQQAPQDYHACKAEVKETEAASKSMSMVDISSRADFQVFSQSNASLAGGLDDSLQGKCSQ